MTQVLPTNTNLAPSESKRYAFAGHVKELLARRHSYETGTLRDFDVSFANASTFSEAIARLDATGEGKGADGHVIVLLPDANKTRD